MTSETLIRPDGTALVYDKFVPAHASAKAGVIFMHGFKSDRNAAKALYLDAACRRLNIPFIRYDAYAHGNSGGEWVDFTISRAVHDGLLVLDQLTQGPQILVGSSMGGWVALRLMEERPERIAGLVGIATAPDFTEKLTPSDEYSQNLIDDGPDNLVMTEDWTFQGPVHLVQGLADQIVPSSTPDRIIQKFPRPQNVRITRIEGGIHNLNRPEDLDLQEKALLDVLSRI